MKLQRPADRSASRRTVVRAVRHMRCLRCSPPPTFSWGFTPLWKYFKARCKWCRARQGASVHFEFASMAIGAAVFFDGLDGHIARMTNTVSDFGREMDSLADVITFGIAPAVLAFAWGIQFIDPAMPEYLRLARLLCLLCIPVVWRDALGSLQCPKKSHTEESRPARSQIFRRFADSGGGGFGCQRGLRLFEGNRYGGGCFPRLGCYCWDCCPF